MFRKLRNQLLLITMTFMTILLLAAFVVIYMMTYNQIKGSIDQDLMRVSDIRRREPPVSLPAAPPDYRKSPGSLPEPTTALPERGISFSIGTDLSGNVLFIDSFFSADTSFYSDALEIVEARRGTGGKFSLDGYRWAYTKNAFGGQYVYGFIDITSRQAVLDRLVTTFAIVSPLSLLLVFALSFYLTHRSIKPIREAFEKQKQFIANASHELKTPLAVIGTNVDLLLDNRHGRRKDDGKWLDYIKSEVKRMTGLTNDLLCLAKVETGPRSRASVARFNASELVESRVLGMEAAFYEKGYTIDYSIEPGIFYTGNREEILQVVMILLDNAMKYSDENGKVTVRLEHRGHILTLSVTNSGPGISAEALPQIFDRFYRADKSRSRESGGYGLGLSIAKAIVDRHRGNLTCESPPGGPTVFKMKLKC